MSSLYTLRIYDADLRLLAVGEDPVRLNVRRLINEAPQASGALVMEPEVVQDLAMAQNICIYRGDRQVFAGRITSRSIGEETFEFDAIGHEDRLSKLFTPHRWQGWNGQDLSFMAIDVLRRFRLRRWTTQTDWQDAVALYNVDLTTEPGSVMLARIPYLNGEQFVEEGFIRLRADMGPDALATGRLVRWSEDAGDPVRIAVRSRVANSETGLEIAPWTEYTSPVNVENIQENEVTGVEIPDGGRWVELEFLLTTEDTTSPDNTENPSYYGRTPMLRGVELIWRESLGSIAPGNIPPSTGSIIKDGEWNRVTHLKALIDECQEHGYRFRVRHDEQYQALYLDLTKNPWEEGA